MIKYHHDQQIEGIYDEILLLYKFLKCDITLDIV